MEWDRLLSRKRYAEGGVSGRSDYDTIICSTLFRRLQDKAQVFPLDEDDYVRTRLTHSLEVSAVGKKLGEYVFSELKRQKADPWFETHTEKAFSDVLLCAGLVHDIGNPPFGHFGEFAIREWFQKNLGRLTLGGESVTGLLSQWQIQDLYLYEGNAQSLRLLSKTPHLGNGDGFNLSYSILASIIKYPVSSIDLQGDAGRRYRKMGYNFSERELFWDINESTGMNGRRHPLSYLLEATDDIAYRTSDLEDSLVKGVLSIQKILDTFQQLKTDCEEAGGTPQEAKACMDRLEEYYREERNKDGNKPELTALQRWNQLVQEMMIRDAGNAFVRHYAQIMEGSFEEDLFSRTASGYLIGAISELSERWIYTSPVKTRPELFGRRVIDSLLSQFMPAAVRCDTGRALTFIEQRTMDTVSDFYKSMYRRASQGKGEQEKLYLRILMITDYISGMTDSYAKRLYQELFI